MKKRPHPAKKKAHHERPRPLRAAPFGLPEVALAHLDEIVSEVATALRDLPPTRETADLRAKTQQAQRAIVVCARDDFGEAMRSALTAKVLELQSQALVAARVERQRRALSEPRAPRARAR